MVNIFAMVFGVLFLSMPIAILGNNFVLVWSERDRITVISRIKAGPCMESPSPDCLLVHYCRCPCCSKP
jgi:hypothetical protein